MSDSDEFQTVRHRVTSRRLAWRLIQLAFCFGALGLGIVFVLHWILSPTDLNHIVLINRSGTNFTNLNVKVERSNNSRHVVYNGACPDHLIRIVNWPYAFYGDWVEVSEGGTTPKRIPVNSHGRYGHSLIILLGPDGKVLVSHDRWPREEVQLE